ncbi:hypothetical protein [Halobaculum magnesiiphilum]|uniref:Lipoprotein n=1 Tax=Halobaculum magnesiiphilum TaxID=1017351 RepID=A0A8T8W967_9EURY|nr:hypothetical protein [Halobaculum magnesiiphilum]QZP36303.1 hypothetical protein K6T50_08095 [Halobaculum magnesiiphilum]
MQRRALLAALATLPAATVAGCGARGGQISDRSFRICDFDSDCGRRAPDPGGDPVIERRPESREITIYGAMYVGSGSCDRAVLESARVVDDALVVHVGVGRQGMFGFGAVPSPGCTADMSVDRYRVRVRFRSSLPASVCVVEDAAWDPEP